MAQTGGALRRIEREHNDRAWLAWTTAGLSRTKTMPKLEALLTGALRPKRQSRDELQAMFDAVAASWARKRG